MGRKDAETGRRKTKRDKARRNFELHGKHSSRHLRIVADSGERRAGARPASEPVGTVGGKKGKSVKSLETANPVDWMEAGRRLQRFR